MFFDDSSCFPENTLQSHRDNGLTSLLDAEWCCLVSITFSGKVSVDASMNLGAQPEACYLDILEQTKLRCLRDRRVCTAMSASGMFLIRYRIRSAVNYEVFYVAIRSSSAYTPKEVDWVALYFSKAYSNVLLNHELFQQNEYIEGVFNSIEAAVFVLDLNMEIVSNNDAAQSLLPANAHNCIQKFHLYDIPFSDFRAVELAVQFVSSGKGKKYLSDVTIPDQNGNNRIFYITLTALRNSRKIISGMVAVCTDITKFKVMQQEATMLEQFGLLGEIALGVSHDVKNPLMNITSCAHYLQHNWQKPIDFQRYFSLIAQEIERINATVDQLMSFGNITSESDSCLVNINEILYTCIQIIERQKLSARFQDITIESSLSKYLPPIKARVFDLQQAFLNILLNALQSIDLSGQIKIASRFDKKRKSIVIVISDTGCGISEVQMAALFLPYRSTKPNGRGLGLFLTKRTLERYNGSLTITSTQGTGTICTIMLPTQNEQ